jgi:Skp family chaperone for outer membrane proteins
MNTISKCLVFFITLGLLLPTINSSYAEEEMRNIKMGILDVELVIRQSLMAKDIARLIDTKRKKFMKEIKKEELALRKFDEELQRKRVVVSPETFAEDARIFRSKTSKLRTKVQIRNRELSQFRLIANKKLQGEINRALTQVTKRNKFNLVFRYSPQVVLVRPEYLDISKPVLAQLNKNISKYTIPAAAAKIGK